MDFLKKAILRTLIYADIFDYPLTTSEVWKFLIAPKRTKFSSVKGTLTKMSGELRQIGRKKGFYFLKGREKLVEIRKKRKKWSQEKIKISCRIGRWLKLIPWLKMVGITGALAMENAEENDDIDLLIVTSKDRLWLSRLLVVFLTELLGKRRRPADKEIKDKICLNVFLDEENLGVPKKERNFFTAHEVCQMRVIWDRDETYKRFIWENRWVKDFLPNAVKISSKFKVQNSKFQSKIKNYFLDFLEKIAFQIQLAYMKPKRTTEKIGVGWAFFHPKDLSGWVMEKYKRKSMARGIEP